MPEDGRDEAVEESQSEHVRRESNIFHRLSCITACLIAAIVSIQLDPVQRITAACIIYIRDRMNAATFWRAKIDWLVDNATNEKMIILQSITTVFALGWLLLRTWRTLCKPVPDLIRILGVEVPDCPEVSLAGIKHNSIRLQWSRPGAHKPVLKYLIQVNGVNVGDSSKTETAIDITGLKPGHFYNVRVIALGSNNFQAGSKVIRLRTTGRDGRPQLGIGRQPSNASEDQESDSNEDPAGGAVNTVGVQPTALPEGSQAMAREQSSGHSGRRNTGTRKHSPSTASTSQAVRDNVVSNMPEESMHQLTEKFESIRRETDELMIQTTRDAEEFQAQLAALLRDRDENKQALKEKEEASEKLKKDVNNFERLNRQAQTKKSQKEKALRDKQAERDKMQEDIQRWKREAEELREEAVSWETEKANIEKNKEAEADKLRETIRKHQLELNGLEENIHLLGLQIIELEEERKKLPGAKEDGASRAQDEQDAKEDSEFRHVEAGFTSQLRIKSEELQDLMNLIPQRQAQLSAIQAQANNAMYQANATGVDFDPGDGAGKAKSRRTRNRKSRTNTISSPISAFPIIDSPFPSASAYNNLNTASPSFAPGPYIDMSHDTAMVPLSEHGMSEEDIRMLTAGAPLSPTATSLLPSNIFSDLDDEEQEEDDDLPDNREGQTRSFGPALFGNLSPAFENSPQSPASSRAPSLISSPRDSSQNLALYGVSGRDYGADDERRSANSPRTHFGAIGSPSSQEQQPAHKGLRELFSSLPRPRGKTMQDDGPTLGSLKQGQSQSFPRSTEEPEALATKQRRISFSAGFSNFLRGTAAGESSAQGNAPAPARHTGARNRRGFNMFGSSIDDPSIRSDRDPSSPRPTSIASSDFPRPSTDSAPFGWGPAQESVVNRNSPLATNWSVHAPQTWSRNPSRRPSMQHGSSSALTNGLVDEQDGFLPPSDSLAGHASPPASVGVIGTRPQSSHKQITPKLNPAAPAFSFSFTRGSKPDKEKDKGKGKGKESEADQSVTSGSPTASRKSRDTHSIRTQNSLAESYDDLDRISSNPTSEKAMPSGNTPTANQKESSNSLRNLLRKSSSSKFSVSSFRNKETGLFGGKKGGSAANSDRNASVERDGSFDEYIEDMGKRMDSVTSSPMIGSTGSGEWKGKDKDTGTPKEGIWSRFTSKKSKGRESLDVDRSEAETTGTEDEG